ncbi:MAG: Crp/Fnr family transcriptional regulator [Lachnospiraceae bacterium]|nr:Crp/Fnr family transcriptional regulator [Lachnospiraceae bacterium]
MQEFLPVMKQSPFFSGLEDKEILSILGCIGGTVKHREKGSFLLQAGDTTESMGLVLTGSVLVIQEDLWGHRNILSKCTAGDFFGEPYAATPDAVLNISIYADSDCDVLWLHVRQLLTTCQSVCGQHQTLIRNLINVLSRRLLTFNDKITHISKRSTRDKLLSYLSSESIRQNSLSFDIPYDRQQLADYLSVERAAMSSELSKLQKEGLLKTNRKHFELYALEDAEGADW